MRGLVLIVGILGIMDLLLVFRILWRRRQKTSSGQESRHGGEPAGGQSGETEALRKEKEEKERKSAPETSEKANVCLVHTRRKIRCYMKLCFAGLLVGLGLSEHPAPVQGAAQPMIWLEWGNGPCSTADGIAYFRESPRVVVRAAEEEEGLSEIAVRANQTLLYQNSAISAAGPCGTFSGDFYVPTGAEDVQELYINASVASLSGQRSEQSLHCIVDRRLPVLTVDYNVDLSGSNPGSSSDVIATVQVEDAAFFPEGVHFEIQSARGKQPQVSSWISPASGRYVCTLRFFEDDTYYFACSVTDRAGNTSSYCQKDVFILDHTAPAGEILIAEREKPEDLAGSSQGYYPGPVTCTVRVSETDFAADGVKVVVRRDGKQLPAGSWLADGDMHRMQLELAEEGTYQISLSGCDARGNRMVPVNREFVLDFTPPMLDFAGIADGALWEAGNPEIHVRDQNLKADSVRIGLSGGVHGEILPGLTEELCQNGNELIEKLKELPREQEFDDFYKLTVLASDLAGNENSASICFRVNRFGSVFSGGNRASEYFFEENGEGFVEVLGSSDSEGDLIIVEQNVCELEEKEVFLLRGEEMIAASDHGEIAIEKTMLSSGWWEYRAVISGKLLEAEGKYLLRCISRDQAGHETSLLRRCNHLTPAEILAGQTPEQDKSSSPEEAGGKDSGQVPGKEKEKEAARAFEQISRESAALDQKGPVLLLVFIGCVLLVFGQILLRIEA